MGMKNHEVVPIELIIVLSGLKHGGAHKLIQDLLRDKLVAHDRTTYKPLNKIRYDGYKLTYLGYDFLALRTFLKRNSISAVGRQIGIGKESDIFIVTKFNKIRLSMKAEID